MILFFDTETTDKDPNAACLVQLAWMLADEQGNEVDSYCRIVKPDGFYVPGDMIHGISHDQAMKEGISVEKALEAFFEAVEKSDLIVAHNYMYDLAILETECTHLFPLSAGWSLLGETHFCTMQETTMILRIPNTHGRYKSRYKWPKLDELHHFLFGAGFEGAHDAMADVRATARCYFELKKRNLI